MAVKGGCRVVWLPHSPVYHLAHYRDRGTDTITPCGVAAFTRRWGSMEGSEVHARSLGLRRCRRCRW